MVGTNAIKGTRVGSGPMGEAERGEVAPRVTISYWCGNGHESTPSFAEEGVAEAPEFRDCPRCGLPSGRDRDNPPPPPRNEPYKTHLAYVKERRSEQAGADLLDEALTSLRERRGTGGA